MELIFNKEAVPYSGEVSVLDCLLSAGYDIPHSCKSGACQSCLLQAVSGSPGSEAQTGLKDSSKEQGWFKSCVCFPADPLEISTEFSSSIFVKVTHKELINAKTLLLRLTPESEFSYRSGQFINLIRPEDRLTRSYSLASIPEEDFLELHIRCFDDGRMSSWLKKSVGEGDTLEIIGPSGDCFYTSGAETQNLLLAGIGTGMAPLYGIVRDALNRGHTGNVTLIQGAMNENGLYYVEQFSKIAEEFSNFTYIPSTVDGSGSYREGKIDDVVKETFPSLKEFKIFLCGSPNTVKRLKMYSFMAGASMKEILSDPFTPAAE